MKLQSATFREHVYFNGNKSFTAKAGTLELHPNGVLIQGTGKAKLLVPWANVLWIELAPEGVAEAPRGGQGERLKP